MTNLKNSATLFYKYRKQGKDWVRVARKIQVSTFDEAFRYFKEWVTKHPKNEYELIRIGLNQQSKPRWIN